MRLRRQLLGRAVLAAAVGLGGLVVPTLAAAPAQAATVVTETTSGYLTMSDDIRLRYTVVKPVGGEKLPTLFEYSGYDPGSKPDANYISQYVSNGSGYNYIGVNLRGTGCSEGTFDFFQPQEALDGAKVIEWITQQSWSDGKVGMIGKSYPGITQLFVAEQNPPGLKAIAPGHFYSNVYRDVARPGGIQNYGFAALWSFVAQPSYEVADAPGQVAGGELDCGNGATAPVRSAPTNPFVQLQEHPWDDDLMRQRSPEPNLDKLRVPMLATLAWQDEQLDSRGTDLLAQIDDLNTVRRARGEAETPWWMTVTNGDHGMVRTTTGYADLHKFYDHFLKGANNGWDQRPRVKVWWDAKTSSRGPTWMSGLEHWSEKERIAAGALSPLALNLRDGGALTRASAAAGEASEQYVYSPGVGSQGIGNPAYGGVSGPPNKYLWDQSPPEGTALHWTSAPLDEDTTLLGSASMDLWLSSTAVDTDLQVTLTEVRPDGKEMYLQKGWLKVSQRKLDPTRSTALRPYQTHLQEDVQLLTPATPVLARVEVFPFGALLRKGSRIRAWVEAPTILPELWAFADFPGTAVNTVLHDAEHPSRLVLPVVPNDANRSTALPACDTLVREPCRTDPVATNPGPEPVVPEVPYAVLLPLVALLVGGAVLRRRRT
ncbi:MAG: CocE/NonD family hydrolase [Frankiaceae bacterium]|nr:CocE/NonD family hydrolase [Frankiaceae bacterium]